MCQEVHLAEIRTALRDYWEEEQTAEDGRMSVDDLLAELEIADLESPADWPESHAFEHATRAAELTEDGDDNDAAAIHYALVANIARSAVGAR